MTHNLDVTADHGLAEVLAALDAISQTGRYYWWRSKDQPEPWIEFSIIEAPGRIEGALWAKMPVGFTAAGLASMITQWLDQQDPSVWPREPNIDGHCQRAWRITTGSWGTFKVSLDWTEYHK